MPDSASYSYRPFRLEIRGNLLLSGPIRIGTGERLSLATDAPVLLDHATGFPYVPGSSLRGGLRDHLEREAGFLGCGQTEIDSLFGLANTDTEDDVSCSGRLSVFDAYSTSGLTLEVRDHVRLNPRWGAADSGAKFDAEAALPADTSSFAVCLVYEGENAGDRELILLGEAVRFLKSDQARVGAKSGNGYGRVRLDAVTFSDFDRCQPTGLASYLSARMGKPLAPNTSFSFPSPEKKDGNGTHDDERSFSALTFRLRLHFEGPVLIKAPIPLRREAQGDVSDPGTYAGTGLDEADHVFLSRASDNRHYLPGSGIRGVLRSQALRIDGILGTKLRGKRLPDVLFGWTKSSEEKGAKGLLEIGDGELVGEPVTVYLDHVAIDRMTAAAVDSKKFSQAALASPKFDISVRVQFLRYQVSAVQHAAFLLRDLMGGCLWAGSGVARGYGYIRSAEVLSVQGDLLDALGWQPPDASTTRPGRVGFERSGVFSFSDPALEWLWQSIDSSQENPA